MPFPVNNKTTKAQWRFHTVEQALEDVIYFAQRFSFPHPDYYTASYRPHPSTTPWIVIGGSYPGIRAAYLRIRNPETIYAAWASSAPVEAQIDMSSYWQAAERALPRNCSNDWVAVTKYMDDVLIYGSQQQVHNLKTRIVAAEFTGPGKNTKKLDQLGYLKIIDQFTPAHLGNYLMDPLGHYQVFSSLQTRKRTTSPAVHRSTDFPPFRSSVMSWRLGTVPVPPILRAWPLDSVSRLLSPLS